MIRMTPEELISRQHRRIADLEARAAADAEVIAALSERLALAAGREEIFRVAIEHIWNTDSHPEADPKEEDAPSPAVIWAWYAINDADTLEVTMGAAPDFEHQRKLRRERLIGRDAFRKNWPFRALLAARDGRGPAAGEVGER